MQSSHAIDRAEITFDDDNAVANAGIVLTATLAERLGLEQLVDETLDLGDRAAAARPGRKVMTLVQSMVLGGDCIDDSDVLRSGDTQSVLPHRPMAPSTLGTFLRSFTFGHVRQLDKVSAQAMARAWAAGAGPGEAPMTIDVDSTVCEVHGYHKGGATYSYTRTLGYHPLLATRADTGEILHARQRTGKANSARGVVRFLSETVARVRRAGAAGALRLRADSGFHSEPLIARCQGLGVAFSITVRQTPLVKAAIAAISVTAWTPIDYPSGGEAYVAEGTYKGHRLIVRRTRLVGPQAELWPEWRYHGFVSDVAGDAVALDQDPSPPRGHGARHPRPEGGFGAQPRSLGPLLRQLGVAGAGRPRAQPPAVDGSARPAHRRSCGRQDHPSAVPSPARPAHPVRTEASVAPASAMAVASCLSHSCSSLARDPAPRLRARNHCPNRHAPLFPHAPYRRTVSGRPHRDIYLTRFDPDVSVANETRAITSSSDTFRRRCSDRSVDRGLAYVASAGRVLATASPRSREELSSLLEQADAAESDLDAPAVPPESESGIASSARSDE